MYAKKGANAKVIAALLAIVLLIGCGIGGTIAWLTDKTDEVVNTFTPSDIEITLTESEDNWSKQMIPGKEYEKDPVVSVEETTNVDVYLFVKFEEGANNGTYLTYTSNLNGNGWTKVDKTTNVWYRVVKADAKDRSWELLSGNKVTVNTSVDKAAANNPTAIADVSLKYTAYAIQCEGFATAELAWVEAAKLG